MKKMLGIFCFALLIGLSACDTNKGPVERAGEKVDDAVENIKAGESPLKERGPMEKAGESIDESVRDLKRK